MKLIKKTKKAGIGMTAFIAISIFSTTIAFASPVSTNTVTTSTPYGTLTGIVSADVDNSLWNASTQVSGTAPVIYVSGEAENYYTGNVLSSESSTDYNTNFVYTWGEAVASKATVFATHEVRGQSSAVKYNSVTNPR